MQFLFKVIILFLIVFNFRVPYFYNSAFVSIALCAVYYIIKRGTIPFTYFFQRYNAIILAGTILIAFIVFIITFLHNTNTMSERQMRIWVEFMMLWAIVFALPLLVEGKKTSAFGEILIIICIAYALQGVISFAAYLYAPLGDFLFNLKPESVLSALGENVNNRFRYLNLSGVLLVELTASFGVAFIVFFWVQLRSNQPFMMGWKKYMIFIFIFLGTIFSGRTGFIGLLMGLGGWLFFSFIRVFLVLKQNIAYILGFSLVVVFSYFFLLTGKQRQSFNDEVFPFAFEWYYNYRDYGRFSVGSADITPDHYFFLYDETLIKGHGSGTSRENTSRIYPHSDAGYMNTLVFGGIPFLICLIVYQCLYSYKPVTLALKNKSRNNRIDLGFFLILFVYIFIVDIKAPAIGYLHSVEVMYLALGSAYIFQSNYQKEQDELSG